MSAHLLLILRYILQILPLYLKFWISIWFLPLMEYFYTVILLISLKDLNISSTLANEPTILPRSPNSWLMFWKLSQSAMKCANVENSTYGYM